MSEEIVRYLFEATDPAELCEALVRHDENAVRVAHGARKRADYAASFVGALREVVKKEPIEKEAMEPAAMEAFATTCVLRIFPIMFMAERTRREALYEAFEAFDLERIADALDALAKQRAANSAAGGASRVRFEAPSDPPTLSARLCLRAPLARPARLERTQRFAKLTPSPLRPHARAPSQRRRAQRRPTSGR